MAKSVKASVKPEKGLGPRQEYKRTGTAPTPANSGANSKVTTPKPY